MTQGAFADRADELDDDRIVVIGGGIVGCVIALQLQRAGKRVVLIEAGRRLGGLAAPWELGSITWDRHYHVICESDQTLRSLLRELGLESKIAWTSVRTGFFSDGNLHEFTSVVDFLRFPPLRLHEKLRLGAAIVYASRVDPNKLRNITAERWLTTLCGRRVYSQIWEPLLRAKLGANASAVSASFIAVTIRRLFGARSNTRGAERFGFVPGGYARILAELQAALERAGVHIRTGARIDTIGRSPNGVRIVSGGGVESFGHAVVTVPIPLVLALIPELTLDERQRFAAIPYAGVVCASLLVDRSLSPYYITNITDRWVPFSAIIEFSNVTGTAAFGGSSLVYLPKYVAPDDPLFDRTDEEIRDSFLSALGRMNARFQPEQIRSFRVSRVRSVFPFPIAAAPYVSPPFTTSIPAITLATAAQIDDATLNVDRSIALANAAVRNFLTRTPN